MMLLRIGWLFLVLAPVAKARPNFLILYADDLGIGDIGCFGNDTVRTPNVDSLCQKGAKLSHHMAAAALCTPSRAALMTGRLPIRSGMASWHDLGVIISTNSYAGLPTNETTFPSLLQKQGYHTGLIGKWHLGLHSDHTGDFAHHPTRHGFDHFFGISTSNHRGLGEDRDVIIWHMAPALKPGLFIASLCGFFTAWFLKRKIGLIPCLLVGGISILPLWFYVIVSQAHILSSGLWRNQDLVELPVNFDRMSQRLVNEGLKYMKERAEDKKPFLLMMSWLQVHTFLHASDNFLGKSKHGIYGDEVEELDWSVGEMLKGLIDFGIANDTLVYFSSDNGGHLEEYDKEGRRTGGHNGIYRGGKVQGGQDGGIRMPSAIMWPGEIPAGSDVTEPTSQMDLFTTFVKLAGGKIPDDRVIDGKDIMPLVKGKEKISPHRFMFHYCCMDIHSVRYRPTEGDNIYKLHYHWPDWEEGTEGCRSRFACGCYRSHSLLPKPKLYNIAKDHGEKNELDLVEHKHIIDVINQARDEQMKNVDAVPNQFNMKYSFYRPWLHYHTSCNFPFFNCQDPQNALTYNI